MIFPRKEDALRYQEGQHVRVTGQVETMGIILAYLQLHLRQGAVTIEVID